MREALEGLQVLLCSQSSIWKHVCDPARAVNKQTSVDTDFLPTTPKETYTEGRFFFNADLREVISMWLYDKGTEKYMPTYAN